MSKLPNIQYHYIIDNNRKKVSHDIPDLKIRYVNHFKYFNSLLYVSNQLTKNLDVSIGYKPEYLNIFTIFCRDKIEYHI
jgi:hypothetical protein